MNKLGIIIIVIISLISCSEMKENKQKNVELIFHFNTTKKTFKNPLMCRYEMNDLISFGIPENEQKRMKISDLNKIEIKYKDSIISIAKPLELKESNPSMDVDAFVSINGVLKKLVGNVDSNNTFWFWIHNNSRNENKLSYIIDNLHLNKCKNP